MPDPVSDLFALEGFRTGLLFGFVAALGVALVVVVGRSARPWAGAAFAIAGIAALDDLYRVDTIAIVGIVALVLLGHLAAGWAPLWHLAAAVPGTVVLAVAAADLDRPAWAGPMIAGTTLVGGFLAASYDRVLATRGMAPLLLAVTTLGVYLTTPDTEHAAVLFGVALPVALLAFPWPLATLGIGGSFAAAGVLAWVVAIDGLGRDGALVGGVACLGMLALEPAVRAVGRGRASLPAPVSLRYSATVVVLHVVLVAVCSRVGGLRQSAIEALLVCAVAYALAAVVLVVSTAGRPARRSVQAA